MKPHQYISPPHIKSRESDIAAYVLTLVMKLILLSLSYHSISHSPVHKASTPLRVSGCPLSATFFVTFSDHAPIAAHRRPSLLSCLIRSVFFIGRRMEKNEGIAGPNLKQSSPDAHHGFHLRITIPEILENDWFKKGYKPPHFEQEKDVSLDDVDVVFNESKGFVKRETSFASKCPPNEIMSKIEETSKIMGFNVHKRNYKMKLQGDKTGRKGHLAVAIEV
ncbi:hypothetical protein L1887_14375 [Cichorium endivia]|nr:hypothetical protein L1887_14375 [Cichorium endivia]